MNEEIMNYEEEVMTPDYDIIEEGTGEGKSGLGSMAFMAIGAALAVGGTYLAKGAKKLWNKHKAKKELRQPNDGEIVEVTDEQIMEVAE